MNPNERIGGEWRRARDARHVCTCGKRIKAGTRYLRRLDRVDGDLVIEKEADHIHSFEEEEAHWAGLY